MAEWYNCEVTRTGPAETGDVFIMLRPLGNEFTERWFKAHATVRKEMLSTALSAISLRATVNVGLAGTAEYSVVERLYVNRPPAP